MRLAILIATLTAGPALAHPGHLAEVAGHGHWIAGAAIGLAVLVGLWSKARERGAGADAPEEEAEDEAEPEEARA
jgi:hypothetical protein